MSRINKIKEIINTEKTQASRELFDAAVSANTKKIESLSKEVQIINSLYEVIEKNIKKPENTKSSKKNQSNNTNPITDTENTTFSITDDLTNKRPLSINMDDKNELVNSFRSLTETACRLAYNKNPHGFMELCNNPNVNGDKHAYFAKDSKDMSDPVMIGTGRNAVYVDIAKLAINNLYFLKKSLTELGYNLADIKVSIDPNYSRKPREKKQA